MRNLWCVLWLASFLFIGAQAASAAQIVTLPPGVPAPTCVPPGVEVAGSPGLPLCESLGGGRFGPPEAQPCRADPGLTAEAIRVQVAGGGWQDASKLVCLRSSLLPGGPSGVYASWSLELRTGDQDLAKLFPAGTRFSMALKLADSRRAEMIYGSMQDPVATFAGARVVVEGVAGSLTAPFQYGPGASCTGLRHTIKGNFSGTVTIADLDAPRGNLDGIVVGTDAASSSPPIWDGRGFTALISGCGDGNPATDDGRYQAFIPQAALAAMGVGAALAPVAAELLAVVNDGAVDATADVEPATAAEAAPSGVKLPASATPAGVVIDYRLSYSSHSLRVRVDRRKLRAARRCVARKLRPHVRRGSVTCKRKRR